MTTTTRVAAPPPRLVDLAVEWPLQYAGESTAIDAEAYPGARDRLGQVDGYLSATRAAIVWVGPAPGDRPDAWGETWRLFGGIESEFSGRLIADPADLGRLDAEPPDAMTWAVVGLRGAADLLREEDAVDRLAALIDRGVRAVRLAGLVDRPAAPGADRGLSDAEREAIGRIASACSGRPLVLDLAGLPPTAAGEAMTLLESGAGGGTLVPIVSPGGDPDGLRPDDEARLRALGGLVVLGPSKALAPEAEAFGRLVDGWIARVGLDRVALGTGFLGPGEPIEGLGDAPGLLDWLSGRFDPDQARAIASENAHTLIRRVAADRDRPSPA